MIKVYQNFEFTNEDPGAPGYAKDWDAALEIASEIIWDLKPHDFDHNVEEIKDKTED